MIARAANLICSTDGFDLSRKSKEQHGGQSDTVAGSNQEMILQTWPCHHILLKQAGILISAKSSSRLPGIEVKPTTFAAKHSLNPRSAPGARLSQPRSAEIPGFGAAQQTERGARV
jgi:hypothetical protein